MATATMSADLVRPVTVARAVATVGVDAGASRSAAQAGVVLTSKPMKGIVDLPLISRGAAIAVDQGSNVSVGPALAEQAVTVVGARPAASTTTAQTSAQTSTTAGIVERSAVSASDAEGGPASAMGLAMMVSPVPKTPV